jgi:hypothetical protein
MRLFFNLRSTNDCVLDEEGLECASAEIAVEDAISALAGFHAEPGAPSDDWAGWRLEIVDITGALVAVLRLDRCAGNALNSILALLLQLALIVGTLQQLQHLACVLTDAF